MEFLLFDSVLGLGSLVDNIISNWIGPILIGILAVVALVLLWKRQFAGFLTFAAMAVLAAILIFGGKALFGQEGSLTTTGKDLSSKIGKN